MNRFHPVPSEGAPPFIIAHRGISAKAPENTLASFLLARDSPGIDMVELDVHLSKEQEVIVLHDRTLQRTTTGNGPARAYSLNELREFDAGSWFHPRFATERIPTLGDVLTALSGKRWVNIEIKSHLFHREPDGLLERRVTEVVSECNMGEQVMYSSFDHHLLASLKHTNPGAITGVLYNLYRDFGKRPSKIARTTGASIFVCAKHELTRAMVADAHAHRLAIYVYTLNSVADARRMLELNVDGIISDNADDIVSLVKSNDIRPGSSR